MHDEDYIEGDDIGQIHEGVYYSNIRASLPADVYYNQMLFPCGFYIVMRYYNGHFHNLRARDYPYDMTLDEQTIIGMTSGEALNPGPQALYFADTRDVVESMTQNKKLRKLPIDVHLSIEHVEKRFRDK